MAQNALPRYKIAAGSSQPVANSATSFSETSGSLFSNLDPPDAGGCSAAPQICGKQLYAQGQNPASSLPITPRDARSGAGRSDELYQARTPIETRRIALTICGYARSIGFILHLKPVDCSGLGYFSLSCWSDRIDGSNRLKTIPFMDASFDMDLYFAVQCDWESLHRLLAGACERILCRPL